MKDKKIIIAGGTGFIGQGLLKYFGRENEVIILGRQAKHHITNLYAEEKLTGKDGYHVKYLQWDGRTSGDWAKEINDADIVINLAGKSVNCRYHKKQKNEIISSRINATNTIGKTIQQCTKPPRLWINMSSATIYKHSLNHPNDETTGKISDLKKDNMPFNVIDAFRFKIKKLISRILYGSHSMQHEEKTLIFL